ncbi:MAG: hypothetical protein ACYCX4_14395 [Bacillota bacterium]
MADYKPSPGLFDLTSKPKTLTAKEHQKIQQLQMNIAEALTHKERYKYMPWAWQRWQEASAELQQIILQHWNHDEIFKGGEASG